MYQGWVAVFFLLFLTAGTVSEGPVTIRFETDIGPATLDHRGHQRRLNHDCSVCHHQEDKPVREACRGCHKLGLEAHEGGPPSYFDVKMKLCRGCHLSRREEDKASRAPIGCSECHDIRAKAKEQGSGIGEQGSGLPTRGKDAQ
jgi:hypothetical protein